MPVPFTVASWNLFQGLHHSAGRGNWVPNPLVEQHLRDFDADVLILPEAWRFQDPAATWAAELAASLGYKLHQWVADAPSRARDLVPFHMGVMTRIPATRLDDIVLPRLGPFGQRAIIKVRLDDSGVVVAGAHQYGIHLLLKRSPRHWMRERAELRAVAQSVDVLGGDMNMWSPIVRRDAKPLRSAVAGRTFPAHRPHSQIDHLMVSERLQVVASGVQPDMGSDHRAITATLALR